MTNPMVLACLLAAAAWPPGCLSDTLLPTTHTLTVSAQIVTGCSVINGSGGTLNLGMLNFGTWPAVATGPVGAAQVSGSGVQIQCTPGLNLSMTVDGGLHPTAGNSQRNLLGPNATSIAYQLYADAGHTRPIGIGEALAVPVSGGTVTLPIYGGLTLPGPTVPPGTYTDTVQVTLSY